MNLEHLDWPDTGWGYLPPSDVIQRMIQYSVEASGAQEVLEIGFNKGHSSTYFLELTDVRMTTMDPGRNRLRYVEVMENRYGPRFKFYLGRFDEVVPKLTEQSFDLAFVDGNHTYEDAFHDIRECATTLDIPYILLDNYDQSGVRKALKAVQKTYGDMTLLMETKYPHTFKGKTNINSIALYRNDISNRIQESVRQRD